MYAVVDRRHTDDIFDPSNASLGSISTLTYIRYILRSTMSWKQGVAMTLKTSPRLFCLPDILVGSSISSRALMLSL